MDRRVNGLGWSMDARMGLMADRWVLALRAAHTLLGGGRREIYPQAPVSHPFLLSLRVCQARCAQWTKTQSWSPQRYPGGWIKRQVRSRELCRQSG